MSQAESETFEAKRRRLCPDGSCVGLVGADGRCRVCGTLDTDAPVGLGPEAFAGGCASEEADDFGPLDPPAARARGADDEDDDDGGPGFDPNRVLCLDGSCTGVIGPDGCCSVCGRPSGPAAAVE